MYNTNYYYMIIRSVAKNPAILHVTDDYYYFNKLRKKYINDINIFYRKISKSVILQNCQVI